MIYVCNLRELPHHAARLAPSHLVSLLPEAEQPATPEPVTPDRHLRIGVDDILEPISGYVAPNIGHVTELIDFVGTWPATRPLLLHCMAGVSRSMAAALITLAVRAPGREMEAARHVRRAAPHAQPNMRLIKLADGLIGACGRLVAAREAMGPAVPVLEGPLVALPLLDGSGIAAA